MSVDRDDALMDDLRRIARVVDAPPYPVREAARTAFLSRDLDAEIAHLVADSRAASLFEEVRAVEDEAQGQWLLSFEGGGVHIDLEIGTEPGGVRLVGMLSGVEIAECSLQSDEGSTAMDLDELGRFVFDGLAPGRIRMRCRLADGRLVTTRWVRI